MQLIIDGYQGDQQKLQDLALVYEILDELPGLIRMRKIMPPHVQRYGGGKPEDGGISGFVIIAESHISIHTLPMKQSVNVDIFSCKRFDAEKATSYVVERFDLKDTQTTLIERNVG